MDVFISRKRRRTSPPREEEINKLVRSASPFGGEEESTDVKLAILSSLHPSRDHDDLLEILLSCDGSVETAIEILASASNGDFSARKKRATAIGMQSALSFRTQNQISPRKASQSLTKKGKTLHLYTPEDIASHTPCSIIHNFLPVDLANLLLKELLPEAKTFSSVTFKLFDNIVHSPHTACFYVDSLAERQKQKSEYLYNGSNLDDVREILPVMRQVSSIVEEAVNKEIAIRIRDFYPDGRKLKYQSPKEWKPNAAFVNCYDGCAQSVGYHTDQLSYLGPRAVIGSLSLGVAREFRVRKIVPKDEPSDQNEDTATAESRKNSSSSAAADASGQIAIHLPHNSLLIMHAEMQEEWKHSIAPAQSIDPHPLAGNKRINITYRFYRDEFNPKFTPKCKCGVPTVLKTVQKQKLNRGRYMWMCQIPQKPGAGGGCGFFEWAEFTDDGLPVWKHRADKVDGDEK